MGGYVTMAFVEIYPGISVRICTGSFHAFFGYRGKAGEPDREISLVLCGKKRQIVLVNIPKAFATDNLAKCSEPGESIQRNCT